MMKRLGLGVVGVLLALSFSTASYGEAQKGKAPAKSTGGKAVLWAAEDLKWVDPPNSPPGVKMAVLWGDPAKGPNGTFQKLPAGFSAPLHYHSSGHKGVVISGTLALTPEGASEKKLGPGSYFTFTGKKKHITRCEPGADCVLFIDAGGPWDVVLADAKKEEPKK